MPVVWICHDGDQDFKTHSGRQRVTLLCSNITIQGHACSLVSWCANARRKTSAWTAAVGVTVLGVGPEETIPMDKTVMFSIFRHLSLVIRPVYQSKTKHNMAQERMTMDDIKWLFDVVGNQ